MDTTTLVEEQRDGGRQLVGELVRLGLDVSAACWIKVSETNRWKLYVVSKVVDEKGLKDAFQVAHPALVRMGDIFTWSSALKFIGLADPLAQEILAIRNLYPARKSFQRRDFRLGNKTIEDAYFYSLRSLGVGRADTSPLIHYPNRAELLDHVQKQSKDIVKAVIPLPSQWPENESDEVAEPLPPCGMALFLVDGSKELLAKEDAEVLLNDGLLSRQNIRIELLS